jgi:hypothetical protein
VHSQRQTGTSSVVTTIVFFKLAAGIDRRALVERYESTAKKWVENPDLIEKWYFYNEQAHEGGGIYIWKNLEAAKHWLGADYQATIERLYGYPPRIQFLDAVMRVDPLQKTYHTVS